MTTLAHLRGVTDVIGFDLPLRLQFRGVTHREGLLLHGPAGWGEWAPFLEYDDVTAARWLNAALESACEAWPAPMRADVECAGVIPALAPDDAAAEAAAAVTESGVRTLKVKVAESGEGIAEDIERLAAVFDATAPDVRVRIDANRGWSVEDAVFVTLRFPARRIDYLEQPCVSLAECADVRRRTGLRVAIDESLRIDDPGGSRVVEIRGAADVVIVKAAPLGGIRAAQRVIERIGLPAVVSGALDSAVGLSAGVALAAAMPGAASPAGLGTGRLLAHDVVGTPWIPVDGVLHTGRRDPGADAMATSAISAERRQWWQARLDRCTELLADSGQLA